MKDKIDKKIADLEAKGEEMVPVGEVKDMLNAVKSLFEGDFSGQDLELFGELGELAKYINRAKKELREFQPQALSEDRLPEASDQLAAIVSTTEAATTRIMDSCDQIDGIHTRVHEKLLCNEPPLDPDVMASVDDAFLEANTSITNIYESCNFQDLTGQRIQKIVETLREVERQVLRMIIVFGLSGDKAQELDEDHKKQLQTEADLLNGPQLPGQSLEQDDIDDILDSLL